MSNLEQHPAAAEASHEHTKVNVSLNQLVRALEGFNVTDTPIKRHASAGVLEALKAQTQRIYRQLGGTADELAKLEASEAAAEAED